MGLERWDEDKKLLCWQFNQDLILNSFWQTEWFSPALATSFYNVFRKGISLKLCCYWPLRGPISSPTQSVVLLSFFCGALTAHAVVWIHFMHLPTHETEVEEFYLDTAAILSDKKKCTRWRLASFPGSPLVGRGESLGMRLMEAAGHSVSSHC